jgi:hypothetical protein
MVELDNLGSKYSTWYMCLYFSEFILEFNNAILLVGGDMPVDNKAYMVTSSISWFVGLTQPSGGAHKNRVCMRTFIGMSSCIWALLGLVEKEKYCVKVFF